MFGKTLFESVCMYLQAKVPMCGKKQAVCMTGTGRKASAVGLEPSATQMAREAS